MFGEPLDLIMNLQKNDTRLKIPKIVTFLTRAVHDLNGKSTEGIFRVSGDADAVTDLVSHNILNKQRSNTVCSVYELKMEIMTQLVLMILMFLLLYSSIGYETLLNP